MVLRGGILDGNWGNGESEREEEREIEMKRIKMQCIGDTQGENNGDTMGERKRRRFISR